MEKLFLKNKIKKMAEIIDGKKFAADRDHRVRPTRVCR